MSALNNEIALDEMQEDVLIELLNIGMGRAADSISQMVQTEVELSIPHIQLVSPNTAAELLAEQTANSISGVSQRFNGPFTGNALLVFPDDQSHSLVALLIPEGLPADVAHELEEESLLEVGNIMLYACLGSLGNILEEKIEGELPIFSEGTCLEVIQAALPNQKDQAILFLQMKFSINAKEITGFVALTVDTQSVTILKHHISNYIASIT